MNKIPTNKELADLVGCSVRTISKMRSLGYDAANPQSVARYLENNKRCRLTMYFTNRANLQMIEGGSYEHSYQDGFRQAVKPDSKPPSVAKSSPL